MVPAIVPIYAAMLAFLYIALFARVIQARRSAKVAIGTRGDVHLERKMRVHANFAEYVPFALLLATFIESKAGRRGSYICFALRLWLDASSMPMAFLKSTRILSCGWSAWRRPLLSLP
jgi:uncharacterized membrane protein YecN with MAPEG domain